MADTFRSAAWDGGCPLLVAGGPRFDESMALELGVDKIFTRGATPREVASYLVSELGRSAVQEELVDQAAGVGP